MTPNAHGIVALPRPGRITVSRVAAVPRPGSLPTAVVLRRRAAGSIEVARIRTGVPAPGSLSREVDDSHGSGDTEIGQITVSDGVVTKIASRAAAENPDAGGVATRVLGSEIPGLDKLGGRTTSLDALPKVSGEVDGTRAFFAIEISVRYPAAIAEVTEAVRRTVTERVRALAGVEAAEVAINVRALVTDLPAPPRVR